MKPIVLVAIAIMAASCFPKKAVVVTLDQIDAQSVFEVYVSYDFKAKNGRVTFTIHNLSPKPVYWDLKKSILFINDYSHNYWDNSISITSVSQREIITNKSGISVSNSRISSKERISFIAPRSEQTISLGQLPGIDTLNNQRDTSSRGIEFKSSIFDYANSPVRLRNYLTFSYTEDFKDEFVIDNHWFAKKVSVFKQKHFYSSFREENSYYYFYEDVE